MKDGAFVLAHVSDLHVSSFGDTFHDNAHRVRRSGKPFAGGGAAVDIKGAYEVAWEEAGWRVLRERGKRRVVLLDPLGYEHSIPSARKGAGVLDPVERGARKACRLEARTAQTLSRASASAGALEYLARTTPQNSNVRLLRAASMLDPEAVDAVFITGDLTDDGVGYELITEAFRTWHERGMLFAVPGNHDLYLFPLFGSERPRPTFDSKRAAWSRFESGLRVEHGEAGVWHRYLKDAGIFLVGLDSCARKQPRFFRHNGSVGKAQLAALAALAALPEWKQARHRIVGLHHHVVPLPHGVGRAASPEIGMRLDDAKEAAEVFNRIGIDLVLHGHRHISEERKPAGTRFRILASPSFTLGCRSGDAPSYWRVELGAHIHAERVYVALSQPQASSAPPSAVSDEDDEPIVDEEQPA
jgi:3',5'-cyclic-AMP phosphodiesterase